VWLPQSSFVYLGVKEIKVMTNLKAVARSGKDYMGFTWFEIFKNGISTGNQYNAIDKDHAIRMYNQTIMP
jgi:hypothetical protein